MDDKIKKNLVKHMQTNNNIRYNILYNFEFY